MAILRALPPAKVAAMQRAVLWVRDYFVYKDVYNPDAANRRRLLASGRPGQDAFLLLVKALEARARGLGRLHGAPADERHASGLPQWAVATSTSAGTSSGMADRGRRRRFPPGLAGCRAEPAATGARKADSKRVPNPIAS